MTGDSPTPSTTNWPDPTPEAAVLEAEIERAREDLAQTVDQLAAKLDMKTRIRQRAVSVKDGAVWQARRLGDRATDADGRPTGITIGAGVAVAVMMAVVVLGVRRRRGHR